MPTTLFVALVFAVAILHVVAAAKSGGRPLVTAAVLAGVMAVSYAAGVSGLLADFDAWPPKVMPFLTAHFIATIAIGLSVYGKRLATNLPVWALVGFQAFRIPVELLLHAFYEEGRIPVQMTYLGRNFDAVTGITAILVAWLAWSGKLTRSVLIVWNILGLALLVNIVTIAILSMPTPIRVFLNEPANRFVAEPPYTWLPTILVTTALLGHIVAFRIESLRGNDSR